jgi:uncharacterized short protein YbdD (DUF466 family)
MATPTAAKAPLPSGIVSYEDYIAKNKVKAPSNTMTRAHF